MKRQILICVFVSLVLILLVVAFVKMRNEDKQPKKEGKTGQITTEMETEDNVIEISKEFTNYKYFVVEEDGRLTVYETATKEIFMETDIQIRTLTEQLQKNLRNGIYFETEEDLFDFLESYSS